LMCWCVDVLMCWCVDVLMCWCVDVLMCWCVDVLMCWYVDVLMCWCVGYWMVVDVLMCWCVDVLMCWCVDVLMCWYVDVLMCWCVDVLDIEWLLMCWCVGYWMVVECAVDYLWPTRTLSGTLSWQWTNLGVVIKAYSLEVVGCVCTLSPSPSVQSLQLVENAGFLFPPSSQFPTQFSPLARSVVLSDSALLINSIDNLLQESPHVSAEDETNH